MKQILICLLLLILIGGCNDLKPKLLSKSPAVVTDMKTIEIDGCEYLIFRTAYDYAGITHKGNCKYCISRNNKSSDTIHLTK